MVRNSPESVFPDINKDAMRPFEVPENGKGEWDDAEAKE